MNRQTSITFSSGDEEMIALIMQRLGVGQSDAIRTAIRVYAAILTKPRDM